MSIQDILKRDDPVELKSFFAFNSTDSDDAILLKFNIWARKYHAKYFSSADAPFHKDIDRHNLEVYRGVLTTFVDIAFRGAAKTARTKLFISFCICNDMDHFRKYFKVLSEDDTNSKQIVTDIYNMLVSPAIKYLYPELWTKTDAKREETKETFTTSTGIKMLARTVIADKRGGLQEEARPDFVWFEDFENRKTLRSRVLTKALAENMEEARTGLAKGGGSIYTCNYISEQGNVHSLVMKTSARKKVLIQSILSEDGAPSWSRYSMDDIEEMRSTDADFEGERLCKPSASKDIYFDREVLDVMAVKLPIRTIAGFKIFREYDPSHRYGSGHDVAGGVGLDSSTSVFIDFDTIPAQVVATYSNNMLKPEVFGNEIAKETEIFGKNIAGIEKNYGDSALLKARLMGANLYKTRRNTDDKIDQSDQPTEYGWHTNGLTKDIMLSQMERAISDGLIQLNDPDLIAEAKAYTRNDLLETVTDPRLVTRHFDLLMALCIAWQTKSFATVAEEETVYEEEEDTPQYSEIGI